MTKAADSKPADKAEAPKKDAVEAQDAPEAPAPLVTTDNPEGIDMSKGDKDAATAYQED
jgi:hypothetical protein